MLHSVQEYEPETNIAIHKSIRFNHDLTFGERMFFAEVESISKNNEKGICPFSSRKFSQLFGVSHQAILNWIRKLSEMGLIEVCVDYNSEDYRQFLKIKKNSV